MRVFRRFWQQSGDNEKKAIAECGTANAEDQRQQIDVREQLKQSPANKQADDAQAKWFGNPFDGVKSKWNKAVQQDAVCKGRENLAEQDAPQISLYGENGNKYEHKYNSQAECNNTDTKRL